MGQNGRIRSGGIQKGMQRRRKHGCFNNGVAVGDLNANLQDAYVLTGSRMSSRLSSQGRPAVQRVVSLGIGAWSEGLVKAMPVNA